MPRSRRFRRPLLAAGGTVAAAVLAAAVLAVEIVVAGNGPRVAEFEPGTADGPVAGRGPEVRVVWLGDSTAAGVGASGPDGALARQVARATGRATRLTVRAVSGARVADVVAQAGAVDPATDVVVVSAGSNDATHTLSPASVRADYERLVAALPPGPAVVLLGVPDIGTATRLAVPLRQVAGWSGGRVDGVVRDVAAARGLAYVDIAGRTGAAFRAEPDRYLAADRYHPNDAGYGLWREAVAPVVADVLARR